MTNPNVGNFQNPEGFPKLQERETGPHDNQDGLAFYCEKLLDDAAAIEILERLSGRGHTLAYNAVHTLTTTQTTRDAKLYQLFLHDILRTSGPEFVLLVSGLGKQRVARLSEKEKVGLVRWVKNNRVTISSSSLQSLTKEYQMPLMNDCRLAQVEGGSRKRVREEAEPLSSSKKSNRLQGENMLDAVVHNGQSLMEVRPITQHGDPGLDRQHLWEKEVKEAETLIGDIYSLTIEDARIISHSDQIRGMIWLTDTYYGTTRPLVTIPISEELRDQLISRSLLLKTPETELLGEEGTGGDC